MKNHSYKGAAVSGIVQQNLEEHGLSVADVEASTTDNAPNIKKAAEIGRLGWHGCTLIPCSCLSKTRTEQPL